MGGSMVEVTDRLMVEFEPAVPLAEITRVVREAERDLAGAPPGAMPELVERCARQRLLDHS